MIFMPVASQAAFYNYTEWYAMQTGIPGSMTGQLLYDNLGNYLNVSYAGNVVADSQINNTGTYYYTGYNGGTNYYINSTVSNAPSRKDVVALAGQTVNLITNTLTFSRPIKDPIMSIVSLGSAAQVSNYDFNTPFTILSQGAGYFGNSAGLWNPGGNRLSGMEGNGVIQFTGTFTSITFQASPNEYWGGFTIGLKPVPEPATMLVLSGGLLALVRRRKRA